MFNEKRVVVALRLFLALLFSVLVVLQTLSLPGQFAHMAEVSPDLAPLRWPMTALSVFWVLCAQIVVVSTWRLLSLVSDNRIFTEDAMKWVDAIVVSVAAAWLVFLGFSGYVVAGADDPSVPIMLILVLTVGAVLGLVVLVLRALLVRATSLQTDLEGVV